jgi:hypothetical protein
MKSVAAFLVSCLAFPSLCVPLDSLPQNNWALVQSIGQGQSIQVTTKAGKSVTGQVERVTESALQLKAGGKVQIIQASEVARVYVVRGRRMGKGTLIGVAVGGGAGVAVGAAIGSSDDWFGPGVWIGTMAAVGVLVGGLIGMAIGSKKKKELVYDSAIVR